MINFEPKRPLGPLIVRKKSSPLSIVLAWVHFFYRQNDFSSEPGVAHEILENEPKNCLGVATELPIKSVPVLGIFSGPN